MVKAALEHRYSDLPTDLKLGFCFGRVVSENDPMLLEKGQALEARFGRKALVDLALVGGAGPLLSDGEARAGAFPHLRRGESHGLV